MRYQSTGLFETRIGAEAGMKPETIDQIRRVVFALGGLFLVYLGFVFLVNWVEALFR